MSKLIIQATVCVIRRDDEILMAVKTRKIGEGYWAPYGGKFEEGENGLVCTVREVNGETKAKKSSQGVILDPADLEKVCIADFHNMGKDRKPFIVRVHFYVTWKWRGTIEASKEMDKPTWFNIHEMPYNQMMAADKDYFPELLRNPGKKFRVTAWYDGQGQHRLKRTTKIREVKYFRSL